MQEVKHISPYLHLWDQSFLLQMDGQDYHHGFFFKAYRNSRTESAARVYFIDIAVLSQVGLPHLNVHVAFLLPIVVS